MSFFNVVLFNPEIPPNTGNIMRLCMNTNNKLHIIKPMGFQINEKSLRRAGMDYIKNIQTSIYENFEDFINVNSQKRFFVVTKFGEKKYTDQQYQEDDFFIFGSESKGLPKKILNKLNMSSKIFIPMAPNNRCLNLSNAVSIIIYEAARQNRFIF